MESNITIYIHCNGVVRKMNDKSVYEGGRVMKVCNVDPDLISEPDVHAMCKEIGITDSLDVYYSVAKIQFKEGIKPFKTDEDALEIINKYASKGKDIHFYIHHGALQEKHNQLDVQNDARIEKESRNSDKDKEEELNEHENYDFGSDYEIGEKCDDDHLELEDFYDSDYGDVSGDGLFDIGMGNDKDSEPIVDPPEEDANIEANENREELVDTEEKWHDEFYSDISSCDTDYDNSDGFSTASSNDDENDGPKRSKPDEFRPQTDMEDPKFKLNQLFANSKQLREAIRNYKIKHGYKLKIKPNEKKRIRVKCSNGCEWVLFASYEEKYDALLVKNFMDIHTCTKAFSSRQVSSKWVARKYLEKFRRQPNMKLTDIIDGIREDFSVEISMSKASRARKYARLMIEGAMGEQYKRVRDYGLEILASNPGSNSKVHVQTPQGYFKRLYICLSGCRKGLLEGWRRVISLDSCHLRGDFPGQLMTAVGIDGNDGMYPLAFAVVEIENKETWLWFLDCLLQDIGSVEEHGWCFTSDQQKGLVPALAQKVPNSYNRFCIRHLYANFKKEFKGLVLKDLMHDAAKETTKQGFLRKLDAMEVIDAKAAAHLRAIPPTQWARHAFLPMHKCDNLLNNLAETFNSKIVEARRKPIITMCETIRRYLMTRIQKNRDAMKKYRGPICPRIQAKLEKQKEASWYCSHTWPGGSKYEVTCMGEQYKVDVELRSCSCNKWDVTGIPCKHACHVIAARKEKAEDYVDKCFHVSTYLKTYSYLIQPTNGKDLWPKSDRNMVLPPPLKRQPGRPRRHERKRDKDEPANTHKLSKKGGKVKCSKCGGRGHNIRGCNGPLAPKKRKSKVAKDNADLHNSHFNFMGYKLPVDPADDGNKKRRNRHTSSSQEVPVVKATSITLLQNKRKRTQKATSVSQPQNSMGQVTKDAQTSQSQN